MQVFGLLDRMVGYTGISGRKPLGEDMRAGVEELPGLSKQYPSKEVRVGAGADFFFARWNSGMKIGDEVMPETLARFDGQVHELKENCTRKIQKE